MRGVIGEIGEQRPNDVTIVDMEASIEHLTRGTVREVDALLVVTEPYYRSLETAGRLIPLAHELGLKRVWVIGNKLRTPRDEAAVREYCAAHDLEMIAAIPYDEAIVEADRAGRALIDHRPAAPAVLAVTDLAHTLTRRMNGANGRRAP